jgi:hypothetical protein
MRGCRGARVGNVPTRAARAAWWMALSAMVLMAAVPARLAAEPCADTVVSYTKGTNGGFGEDMLPTIVLGPPYGEGLNVGSLDVASLGNGGDITLAFEDNAIVDGPGVDFTVFENAFEDLVTGVRFIEAGVVSASADGVNYFSFPYVGSPTFAGLAGVTPVLSHPDNAIDPRDPAESGGDSFDLADVGLASARFVRIVDPAADVDDPGNHFPTPGVGKSGFDLDAVVAVHSNDTCAACCDTDENGTITPGDVLLLLREVSALTVAINPCGALPCRSVHCGDTDDDGEVTPSDVLLCQRLASELPTSIAPCATGACDFAP